MELSTKKIASTEVTSVQLQILYVDSLASLRRCTEPTSGNPYYRGLLEETWETSCTVRRFRVGEAHRSCKKELFSEQEDRPHNMGEHGLPNDDDSAVYATGQD